jgi:hypothetical protein
MNERTGNNQQQEVTILPRFDASYEEFDPRDLEIIRQNIQQFVEDAAEFGGSSLFFARQLDYVKSTVYTRKFPAMNADLLVPDSTDMPEWAETITVYSYDQVGMAKIIANYADDLPRADARGTLRIVGVKTMGDSYGYNLNEIRASRAIGAGLDVRKATAARRAMDLLIARIKMIGDPDYGLYGLFTFPNISEIILPHPGPWDLLDGQQIWENMTAMKTGYDRQTRGTHTANFMTLAPVAYNAASTKLFPNPTPVTALQLFQSMNPGIAVHNIIECEGASPTGRDVSLLYENSVDNFSHENVMPFQQLPPEVRNLEFVTNCIARSGGVNFYYPLAFVSAVTN